MTLRCSWSVYKVAKLPHGTAGDRPAQVVLLEDDLGDTPRHVSRTPAQLQGQWRTSWPVLSPDLARL